VAGRSVTPARRPAPGGGTHTHDTGQGTAPRGTAGEGAPRLPPAPGKSEGGRGWEPRRAPRYRRPQLGVSPPPAPRGPSSPAVRSSGTLLGGLGSCQEASPGRGHTGPGGRRKAGREEEEGTVKRAVRGLAGEQGGWWASSLRWIHSFRMLTACGGRTGAGVPLERSAWCSVGSER